MSILLGPFRTVICMKLKMGPYKFMYEVLTIHIIFGDRDLEGDTGITFGRYIARSKSVDINMKFQFSLSFTRNFNFYPGGVSSNQWFSRILTGPGKGRTLFSHTLLLDVFKYFLQKGTSEVRIQCRQ